MKSQKTVVKHTVKATPKQPVNLCYSFFFSFLKQTETRILSNTFSYDTTSFWRSDLCLFLCRALKLWVIIYISKGGTKMIENSIEFLYCWAFFFAKILLMFKILIFWIEMEEKEGKWLSALTFFYYWVFLSLRDAREREWWSIV